jgi:hypothetical protein
MRYLLLALCLLLLVVAPARADFSPGLRALLAAYPEHLCGADHGTLRWCDGTLMAWDDGRAKSPAERIDTADLEDQFAVPYPPGLPVAVPTADPGRARHEPFFRKMYGADRAAVEANLARVSWPFGTAGATLQVTRVNRVHERLAAVIRELQTLPAEVRAVLAEPAGGYFWRTIAGTDRPSLHSFGIAVDLGGRHSDYWRWDAEKNAGRFAWRNRLPLAIVEVFERHGFIWGGKWQHYDTMHFEYRPELLPPFAEIFSGQMPDLPFPPRHPDAYQFPSN